MGLFHKSTLALHSQNRFGFRVSKNRQQQQKISGGFFFLGLTPGGGLGVRGRGAVKVFSARDLVEGEGVGGPTSF